MGHCITAWARQWIVYRPTASKIPSTAPRICRMMSGGDFLAQQCGDDGVLRAAVEELLLHDAPEAAGLSEFSRRCVGAEWASFTKPSNFRRLNTSSRSKSSSW